MQKKSDEAPQALCGETAGGDTSLRNRIQPVETWLSGREITYECTDGRVAPLDRI